MIKIGAKIIKVFSHQPRDLVVIPLSPEHCRFLETMLTFLRIILYKAIHWHRICFTSWLLSEEKKTAGVHISLAQFTHMVTTLQSVHEMLMCDSSDVIERKCSRWDETVSEIIYTVFR